jgi:CelD/BcsL family acetyltransferase involved in cellulose biosynthesis
VKTGRFATRMCSIADLAGRQQEWQALEHAAIEPNPFYAHAFLTAVDAHLRPRRALSLLIVEDRAENQRLCALLPLERPHWRDGLPFGALALVRNPFICSTVPLIRREDASEILLAALQALAKETPRLLLPMVPEHRPFSCLLKAVADQSRQPLVRVDGRDRPGLESPLAPDVYRTHHWKKSIRASERRRLARLEAQGSVDYRAIWHKDPDAPAALEAFLTLEAKSWKGRQKSALTQKPDTAAFAQAAFLPPEAGSAVLYEVLALNGQAIAVNINLVAQNVGFALKSTYDETYARYGVGTLLDGFSLALATGGGVLARFDSCAPMHHPIHERWRQQEQVSRKLLGLRPGTRVSMLAEWLARTGPYGVWRGFDASSETA